MTNLIAQILERDASERLREPLVDAAPNRLRDALGVPGMNSRFFKNGQLGVRSLLRRRQLTSLPTGLDDGRLCPPNPLSDMSCGVVTIAVTQSRRSIEHPDNFRHRNPGRVLGKHVAPLRAAQAGDQPLFFETMKQLLKVGNGKVLTLGDEGG